VELIGVQVKESVVVRSATAGAALTLDGQPAALRLDGLLAIGKHQLSVAAPGFRTLSREVALVAGKPRVELFTLEREGAPAGAAPAARPEERAVRVGMLVAAALPRPIQAELSVKLREVVALGFQLGMLPGLTLADIDFDLKAYQATVDWFPWRGRFHGGLGVGAQSYQSSSGSAVVRAKVSSTNAVLSPRLGWLRTWPSGLTLGVDLGMQVVFGEGPRAELLDATGAPLPGQPDEDARGIREDAEELADTLHTSILPTLALKLGFYF
jgi:hypothetical protein